MKLKITDKILKSIMRVLNEEIYAADQHYTEGLITEDERMHKIQKGFLDFLEEHRNQEET